MNLHVKILEDGNNHHMQKHCSRHSGRRLTWQCPWNRGSQKYGPQRGLSEHRTGRNPVFFLNMQTEKERIKKENKYMSYKRLTPCIFIDGGKAVKWFDDRTIVSDDVIELAKQYSEKGADELIVFDLSNTDEEHDESIDLIKRSTALSASQ